MKSKFKFKRGEIAHIDIVLFGEKIVSDVQIVNRPNNLSEHYECFIISRNESMMIPEEHLQKKNKYSITAFRKEIEESVFAHLNPERNYDIEYDVLIKEVDSDHKILFKFTSIGSTFIKGDK